MAVKLEIWNVRMMELAKQAEAEGKVVSLRDFAVSVGLNPNNLTQIKSGAQSFRHQHLLTAAKKYNVSMDWLFGLTKYRDGAAKKEDPIKTIEDALQLIKQQQKPVNNAINKAQKKPAK